METVLYLVRHAQAQPLPAVAESEWALSAHGQMQARALVPILTALGIQRVYSSPFRRSQDTLRPFAEENEIPLLVHDGLRERRLATSWIGDFRPVWERSWADFSYALDGGENSLVCRSRMAETVAALCASHRGEVLAAGSHGYAIGLFLTTLDPAFGIIEASALRTPEIIRLVANQAGLRWDRTFNAGADFDAIATHFRQTPGIKA
ncbi:MAG TPA: histidine phosphatase family protein [Opitutaceae bacterium]|nr:histidine phosphatase family protein [Opitutaceae bacterium]